MQWGIEKENHSFWGVVGTSSSWSDIDSVDFTYTPIKTIISAYHLK